MKASIYALFILFYSLGIAQCPQKIAAGAYHTLFIKSDGTLWQMGLFHNGDYSPDPWSSYQFNYPIQLGINNDWKDIQAGWFNSIALKIDGTLWEWEADELPLQLGNDNDWKSISIGDRNCAAIKTDGTLWTWNAESGLIPTQIGSDNDWKEIDCGYSFFLAIKNDGSLWSWGLNNLGQVGDGTFVNKTNPVQIGNSSDWLTISCGGGFSMALKTDHTLWTWGEDNQAQLGYYTPNYANQTTPHLMDSTTDWKSIAASGDNSTAIKNDNTLWIWGSSLWGALGNNLSTNNLLTPTEIGNGNWDSIIVGFYHFFAVKSNGEIWEWGRNVEKQLGLGPFQKIIPELMDCNILGSTKFNLDTNFTLSPNPVNNILYIKSNNNATVSKIVIYDLSGKKVIETTENFTEIDLSILHKGFYLLEITTENNFNYKTKIIKE